MWQKIDEIRRRGEYFFIALHIHWNKWTGLSLTNFDIHVALRDCKKLVICKYIGSFTTVWAMFHVISSQSIMENLFLHYIWRLHVNKSAWRNVWRLESPLLLDHKKKWDTLPYTAMCKTEGLTQVVVRSGGIWIRPWFFTLLFFFSLGVAGCSCQWRLARYGHQYL